MFNDTLSQRNKSIGSINSDDIPFDQQVEPFLIASPDKGSTAYNKVKYNKIRDIEPSSSEKFRLGVSYMGAMGVCGLVLVAIASNLNHLAENCGTEFLKIGSVFIARGFGAIFGTILSAKLYATFPGNETIAGSLFLVVIMLIALPSCTSVIILHIYFFLCGFGTALTDTGCQIMTRKIQGKNAGPWLGANTVCFGLCGAIVPIIELSTSDLYAQYLILSAISLSSVILLWLAPDMEGFENYLREKLKTRNKGYAESVIPHYYVEIVISFMVFFLVGGKVSITAYLNDYIIETKVFEDTYADAVVLVLWIAIATGRIIGIIMQSSLSDESCQFQLSLLLCASTLSLCLIISDYNSSYTMCAGILFYGLFNGPCVGYCYDFLNRSTYPTEVSTSIVMLGVNLGASILPFLVPLLWGNSSLGPKSLMMMVLISCMVPIPLLYMAILLKYPKLV